MILKDYLIIINFFFIFTRLVDALNWKIGDWTECTLNQTCAELGYRRRNVSCFDADRRVEFTLCASEKSLAAIPKSFENCITDTCISAHKSRLKIFRIKWSKCMEIVHKDILLSNTNEVGEGPTKCGRNSELKTYAKSRQTECRFYYKDNAYFILDKRKCESYFNTSISTETEIQFCYSKCVRVCALSLWTKLQTCNYCRENLQYKTRTPAALNARDAQCGRKLRWKTIDNDDENLPSYQVKLSGWRQVGVLYQNKKIRAKFTVHNRNTTCLTRKGDICTVPMNANVPLHQVQVGDRDCLHSVWSSWSSCFAISSTTAVQHRTREIRHYPLLNGKPCDVVRKERACDVKTIGNFIKYEWSVGDWTPCEKVDDNTLDKECAVYKQRRSIFCVSSNDFYRKPVDPMLCRPETKPLGETVCDVICDNAKCVYSDWEEWSECTQGFTARERTLLYGYEKSCELTLQKKQCDITGAKWVRERNSACWVYDESGQCGEGIHKHNITCQDNRIKVQDTFCDPVTRPLETEPCEIPCKKGYSQKCVLSGWTLWTICNSGQQIRTRTILLGSEKACQNTPRKENRNCTIDEYFWYNQAWEECQVDKKNNKTKQGCLTGLQTRNHVCVKNSINNIINNSECFNQFQYFEPSQTRECTLCPKSCVLSPWSDWYPDCLATCGPSKNAISRTHRQRFVISHSNNSNCTPKLIETKQCEPCQEYHWVAQKWDVCTHENAPALKHTKEIMVMRNGYQIRNVYCSDGSRTLPDSLCHGPKPIEQQDCHIDWYMSCNVKPWSDWGECSEYCGGGVQKRSRPPVPKECKEEIDPTIKFNQTRSCNTHPCDDFNIQEGDWGECQLIGKSVSCLELSLFRVNFGIRYRNVSCATKDGKVAPLKYCEELYDETFPIKKSCIIKCSTDCQLSEWSEFTPCSKTCGVGESMRHSKIRQYPSADRPPCPAHNGAFVVEKVPCKVADCFDFEWHKGEWGPCNIGSNAKCGKGMKKRMVFCAKNSTGEISDKCLKENKPRTERQCKIPCEEDCIVSGWTEWSNCSKGVTNRTREILKRGKDCPIGLQIKKCAKQKIYKWKGSEWSSCLMTKGICGLGLRKRIIECIAEDSGEAVNEQFCATLPKQTSFEVCERSCNTACMLSSWSMWSSCDGECGKLTHRRRERIGHGNCDSVAFTETLKCPVLPCFTLPTGKWSPCQSSVESSCGVGMRIRSGTCTRDDGNVVDLNHCLDYMTRKIRLTEECEIPCWTDCITSEWSTWSSCFKGCSPSGVLNTSVQLRSRSILQEAIKGGKQCSQILEEKRGCDQGICHDFDWHRNENGDLRCVRSDGLIVSSGCKQKKNMFSCVCPISNAECIQSTFCTCNYGYKAVLNSYGMLSYCRRLPAMAEKKDSMGVSMAGIICISLAACVGYCLLFIVFFFLYKRRKKQNLAKRANDETPLQSFNNNKSGHRPVVERTRNLMKNNRNSNTSDSSSSTARSELSPLQQYSSEETQQNISEETQIC